MSPPTARQLEYLRFISTYITERGFAPSMRDIMGAFGIRGQQGIAQMLDRLEDHGFITRESYTARSLRVTDAGRKALAS